jgi:hypothetical protein
MREMRRPVPVEPAQAAAPRQFPQRARKGSDVPMTVTIPLVLIIAIIAYACYRYMGLRLWHLAVCLLLGFLLAATSAAPELQNIINTILSWRSK